MGTQELPVIRKTYDLVLWACRHVGAFPRNHRFVLGERMERRLYDLLETLLQARYTKDRQPQLRQANLTLEVLRCQMRLAHDLQCLRTHSYGSGCRALQEMVGVVPGAGAARHGVPHRSAVSF